MKTILVVLCATLCLGGGSVQAQQRLQKAFFNGGPTPTGSPNSFAVQDYQPIPHRSVLLAATLSLLVPGMGELYTGSFESGKYSLLAEGAIWVTYAAFYTRGNWVRRDARVFASDHAGANFTSKNDQFDVNIGNYMSLQDYNQSKLRNRENDLVYGDPSYAWQWDSDADRVAFKNDRIRSDQMYQNAKFVIAAAVVNRVFSAFSAGRAASAFNRKALLDGAWNLEAYPTSTNSFADGINVEFTLNF